MIALVQSVVLVALTVLSFSPSPSSRKVASGDLSVRPLPRFLASICAGLRVMR